MVSCRRLLDRCTSEAHLLTPELKRLVSLARLPSSRLSSPSNIVNEVAGGSISVSRDGSSTSSWRVGTPARARGLVSRCGMRLVSFKGVGVRESPPSRDEGDKGTFSSRVVGSGGVDDGELMSGGCPV